MIITGAITGATLVNGLGFVQALGAILIGLIFSAGSYLVITKLSQPAKTTATSVAN